jgi:hypothetical protein
MAWPGFDGTLYTREQFLAHVAGLTIGPYAKFIVMHATGSPTLKQWEESPEAQRIANLQRYYEIQLGWQHGPHLFISPTHIIGFSDLRVRGTHCSCWNYSSIGIETTGNWNTEDFTTGDGAAVLDNFVYAASVLHKHLGIRPDAYVQGVQGLHFHRECAADGHFECPHSLSNAFTKESIVQKILTTMDALPPLTPNPDLVNTAQKFPAAHADTPAIGSVAWVQDKLNEKGTNPPLIVDGDRGPRTVAAIKTFQGSHNLTTDGIVGPETMAALNS